MEIVNHRSHFRYRSVSLWKGAKLDQASTPIYFEIMQLELFGTTSVRIKHQRVHITFAEGYKHPQSGTPIIDGCRRRQWDVPRKYCVSEAKSPLTKSPGPTNPCSNRGFCEFGNPHRFSELRTFMQVGRCCWRPFWQRPSRGTATSSSLARTSSRCWRRMKAEASH